MTLNPSKCKFRKNTVKFLGRITDHSGVKADSDKTKAVCEMDTPTSVSELRRFLGMVNQLGKFTPHIAELTQPLRELLSTKHTWMWGPAQEDAFARIKKDPTKLTTLILYDPTANVKLSADASSFGLGTVLLLKDGTAWKPVAYASQSMTSTEKGCAQIEKEALAITWACQKFTDYILGSQIHDSGL